MSERGESEREKEKRLDEGNRQGRGKRGEREPDDVDRIERERKKSKGERNGKSVRETDRKTNRWQRVSE